MLGLEDKYLRTLVKSSDDSKDAVKIVTGPGTGLGVSYLLPLGNDNYKVWPTEGGHSNFAPSSPQEIDFLKYL